MSCLVKLPCYEGFTQLAVWPAPQSVSIFSFPPFFPFFLSFFPFFPFFSFLPPFPPFSPLFSLFFLLFFFLFSSFFLLHSHNKVNINFRRILSMAWLMWKWLCPQCLVGSWWKFHISLATVMLLLDPRKILRWYLIMTLYVILHDYLYKRLKLSTSTGKCHSS